MTKPMRCRFGLHRWMFIERLWAFARTWHWYKCSGCGKEKAI